MPRIFISYSRVDRPLVDDLVPLLREVYGLGNVWFDENLHGGQMWWEEILDQIAACDIFIYLVSNEAIASEYCLAEYEEAQRIHKQILPVLVRARTTIPDNLKNIQFVDMSSGIMRGMNKLHAAITKSAAKIQAIPPQPTNPFPVPVPSVATTASKPKKRRTNLNEPWAIIIAAVLTGIFAIIAALIAGGVIRINPTPEPTLDSRAKALTVAAETQVKADEGTSVVAIMTGFVTETQAAIDSFSTATANAYTHTPTVSPQPTNTPTDDYTATTNAKATVDAQAASNVPTNTPPPTVPPTPLPTLTIAPTATPTLTLTVTPNLPATQTAQASQIAKAQQDAQATQNAQATLLANAPVSQNANLDVYGRALPADAAPYDMQVWTEMCRSDSPQTAFMAATTVYQRICEPGASDLFADSLLSLDENLNLIPAAADSWENSADGLTWTFHLRPGQVWSDGTPLTANDWVVTYQWMVDPANAYDFVWMWQGIIRNWSEAVAGEVRPTEIGMVAMDDDTLAITTVRPVPYLLATMIYWPPLQAKALTEHGPNYQLDPATSVSSGPFILKEFKPGQSILLEANPIYNGFRKPFLKEIRGVYGDKLNGSFLAFQNHDIDRVSYEFLTPANLETIRGDRNLLSHYLPYPGDFRTDYLLMDTYSPPFNNLKVRQAFAKAVDRESIVSNVINANFNIAIPAYSFLMPGFPASDTAGDLKQYQQYDCNTAQLLLAEAGYPNGQGFPALELKLRGESDFNAQRFIAAAASIGGCLNVQITVNNMENAAYMQALLARPSGIQFGAISYGMDYPDPANMLDVWVSTGRHSWRNLVFDTLVQDADVFVGDPTTRFQMYKDAEKILVDDVGGIFLDHRIQGDLFQPYIAGDCFRPNALGISNWEWGNDWCWGAIYVTNDVANYDTFRTR